MKIKAKRKFHENGRSYQIGEIFEVSDERAKAFTKEDYEEVKEVEESKVEEPTSNKEAENKNIKRGKKK